MAHALLNVNMSNRQGSRQASIESLFNEIEERKSAHTHRQVDRSQSAVINSLNRPISTEIQEPLLNSGRSDSSNSEVVSNQIQQQVQHGASGTNLDELFSCFICFGPIQNAAMCPSCSKLGCGKCLRKWLTETRQQCPHCRASLRVS